MKLEKSEYVLKRPSVPPEKPFQNGPIRSASTPNRKRLRARSKTRKTKRKRVSSQAVRSGTSNFERHVVLSPPLASLVGQRTMARSMLTKAIWDYAKQSNLVHNRKIACDSRLENIFGVEWIEFETLQGLLNRCIEGNASPTHHLRSDMNEVGSTVSSKSTSDDDKPLISTTVQLLKSDDDDDKPLLADANSWRSALSHEIASRPASHPAFARRPCFDKKRSEATERSIAITAQPMRNFPTKNVTSYTHAVRPATLLLPRAPARIMRPPPGQPLLRRHSTEFVVPRESESRASEPLTGSFFAQGPRSSKPMLSKHQLQQNLPRETPALALAKRKTMAVLRNDPSRLFVCPKSSHQNKSPRPVPRPLRSEQPIPRLEYQTSKSEHPPLRSEHPTPSERRRHDDPMHKERKVIIDSSDSGPLTTDSRTTAVRTQLNNCPSHQVLPHLKNQVSQPSVDHCPPDTKVSLPDLGHSPPRFNVQCGAAESPIHRLPSSLSLPDQISLQLKFSNICRDSASLDLDGLVTTSLMENIKTCIQSLNVIIRKRQHYSSSWEFVRRHQLAPSAFEFSIEIPTSLQPHKISTQVGFNSLNAEYRYQFSVYLCNEEHTTSAVSMKPDCLVSSILSNLKIENWEESNVDPGVLVGQHTLMTRDGKG